MKIPMPGDLQFTFHPGGVLSEAIAFVTRAKISHVQMIIEIGAGGTYHVISAEAEGLVEKWVIPETVPWHAELYYEGITLAQRDAVCKWMWDHRGMSYDVWGLASFLVNVDLNDERKSFCSEANYLAYEEGAGILLLDGVDHGFVSPRDLYINPQLKRVDGQKKEVR